jgi:3-oxoacyl-[acyl-carrier-protein] synthase II
MDDAVVITGIGLVTPAGSDRESSWFGIREGVRAGCWLTGARGGLAQALPSATMRLAGAPAAWHDASISKRYFDPVVSLALRAADEALADAGLTERSIVPQRSGCVIGTSKGGLKSFAAACSAFAGEAEHLGRLWEQFLPDAASRYLAARYNLRGAALCPVAACATGLVCIARGAELIEQRICDVVLAGSADASLCPSVLASFQRLGVLARPVEGPESACRPFDRRRNGFLVGEGAALVVLERASHAASRGASWYANWLAGETAADPAHLAQLETDPRSLTHLIESVLRAARVAPDEVDYISLHGTATRQNDVCETVALKRALGPWARRACGSSLKGTIGHLLGAAGSVELAAAVLALRDGIVPPTANLREPDRECDLDYTPNEPRMRRLQTALKLSLGFGGHLACAVLRSEPGRLTRAAWRSSP